MAPHERGQGLVACGVPLCEPTRLRETCCLADENLLTQTGMPIKVGLQLVPLPSRLLDADPHM